MSGAVELPEEVRIFLVEANENLDQLEQDIVSLEEDSSNKELVNKVFRLVHTIKGNCGFLGYGNLELICHKTETILDGMRSGKLTLTADTASTLLAFVDQAKKHLIGIEATGADSVQTDQSLVARLQTLLR